MSFDTESPDAQEKKITVPPLLPDSPSQPLRSWYQSSPLYTHKRGQEAPAPEQSF